MMAARAWSRWQRKKTCRIEVSDKYRELSYLFFNPISSQPASSRSSPGLPMPKSVAARHCVAIPVAHSDWSELYPFFSKLLKCLGMLQGLENHAKQSFDHNNMK